MVIKKTSSNSKIVFKEKATDDPRRRCPDISLAKEKLDWEPKVSLEQGLDKTIEYFKTIKRPDEKILVFTTTYYPDLGPAEKALFDLSSEMPDTEFHIITTKFRKGMPDSEKISTDSVHRIGFGNAFDKYLLPVLGVVKAYKLHKEHNYRFVWSVMASYGGLAGLILKLLDRDINFLLTLDENEAANRSFIRSKIIHPIYRIIISRTNHVYLSDISLERHTKVGEIIPDISVISSDRKSFANQIRYSYANLINKQEQKLARPK